MVDTIGEPRTHSRVLPTVRIVNVAGGHHDTEKALSSGECPLSSPFEEALSLRDALKINARKMELAVPREVGQ